MELLHHFAKGSSSLLLWSRHRTHHPVTRGRGEKGTAQTRVGTCDTQYHDYWSWVQSQPKICNIMILGPMSDKPHSPTNQSWNLPHAIWSWVQCQTNHTLQQIRVGTCHMQYDPGSSVSQTTLSNKLRVGTCNMILGPMSAKPHSPTQRVVHQALSPAPFPTSINPTTTSLV